MKDEITTVDYKKIIYVNEIVVHYLNSNVSSIILEFIIIKPPLYLVEVAKFQSIPTFHSTHSSKADAYNTIQDMRTLDWHNFGYISVVYGIFRTFRQYYY